MYGVGDGGGWCSWCLVLVGGVCLVLTDRDLAVVLWLGRVKLASSGQVQARFGLWRSKAYRRLLVLKAEGLIGYDRPLRGDGVYYATRKGLRAVSSALSEPKVRLSVLTHDLAVTDVVVALEGLGARVLTEREIRLGRHLGEKERYSVQVRNRNAVFSIEHTPDAAVLGPEGQWIAIEVELTAKTAARTKDILNAYTNHDTTCTGVLYLTPNQRASNRITKHAKTTWLENRIQTAELNEPNTILPALQQLTNPTPQPTKTA